MMNNIKVNRVEQQIIKRNNPIFKIVDCYCLYSKNVYNEANYIMRQEFVNNGNKLNANDIQKLMLNAKYLRLLVYQNKEFLRSNKKL